MNIKENMSINVLNYMPCIMTATSHIKGYTFEPCIDGVPTAQPMSFSEIQNINSKSATFREGFLRFEEDLQEDIYKALKIDNWKDILTNEDIKDIVLHPTKEKLQKIIDIRSTSYFERIRGVYSILKLSGQYDVSMRVSDIIMTRYKELLAGKIKSDITLKNINMQNDSNNVDIREQLSKQQEMIEKQNKMIEEQKHIIEKLTASISTPILASTSTGKRGRKTGSKNKEKIDK